jgi:AraC-like DNA-binding protein
MSFQIPIDYFKNDVSYRRFGFNYPASIFGCGFLNKKGQLCTEKDVVFEHYGVVLILSGEGVHIDNEGVETKLYPGCLIQRVPEKSHSLYIKSDDKWLEFFICIGKDIFTSLSNINLLTDKQEILYPGISNGLFNEFSRLLYLMKHTQDADLRMLLPEALKIIFTLYDMHNKNLNNSEDRELIRQACLMLSNKFYTQDSIREVSKQLGIGYEKFRKIFKLQIGVSPGRYISQKRMDLARNMLIETDNSIKAIALNLGFADTFSFSKQFKNVVGMSPSEFRKKY